MKVRKEGKMNQHRVRRYWYRFVIIPMVFYLVFAWAANHTISNPDTYSQTIDEYQIAEKLAPYLEGLIRQSSPYMADVVIEAQWVKNNLNSICRSFIEYFNGNSEEFSLPVDTAYIYKQLPEEVQNSDNVLPGIADYVVKVKEGEGDLAHAYSDSLLMKKEPEYRPYVRASKYLSHIFAAIILFSVGFSLWRLKERERLDFIKYLGTEIAWYSTLIVVIFKATEYYFNSQIEPGLLAKLTQDWQMAMISGLISIYEGFIDSICFMYGGLAIISAIFAFSALVILRQINSIPKEPLRKLSHSPSRQ